MADLITSLTENQIGRLNRVNVYTLQMRFGTKFQEIIAAINAGVGEQGPIGEQGPAGVTTGLAGGTPVNAVNASKVLTIAGVVIDGETVTIDNPATAGTDVYEFLADTAQSKTSPSNIAVDITAFTTKASRVLTVNMQPTNGDKMTIGTKIFTFVPVGTATADGEISIGADLAGAQANIIAAINGTDGINTAHTQVTADVFAQDACTITALIGGIAGNSIATTETFTAETNIFAGGTLASGADCTAPNAVTALAAAITASDTQGVGGVDGNGDTVDLTADIAGVVGNAITLAKVMANGTFAGGATALSGGVDGTVGGEFEPRMDGSYLYLTVAANTIADKNWRRISIGSAY